MIRDSSICIAQFCLWLLFSVVFVSVIICIHSRFYNYLVAEIATLLILAVLWHNCNKFYERYQQQQFLARYEQYIHVYLLEHTQRVIDIVYDVNNTDDNIITCSICLELLTDNCAGNSLRQLDQCLHIFHIECLNNLITYNEQNSIDHKCPLCRMYFLV